jgi:hypothetical protein
MNCSKLFNYTLLRGSYIDVVFERRCFVRIDVWVHPTRRGSSQKPKVLESMRQPLFQLIVKCNSTILNTCQMILYSVILNTRQ